MVLGACTLVHGRRGAVEACFRSKVVDFDRCLTAGIAKGIHCAAGHVAPSRKAGEIVMIRSDWPRAALSVDSKSDFDLMNPPIGACALVYWRLGLILLLPASFAPVPWPRRLVPD